MLSSRCRGIMSICIPRLDVLVGERRLRGKRRYDFNRVV